MRKPAHVEAGAEIIELDRSELDGVLCAPEMQLTDAPFAAKACGALARAK